MLKPLPLLEIWKDIKGYEGSYQASNLGRIKSLARVVTKCNGVKMPIHEKIIKKVKGNCDYHQVSLSIEHKIINKRVHRLVISAFIGHSDLLVNHIDGDKLNNVIGNLEYVTTLENMNHWVTVLQKKTKYGASFDKTKNRFRPRIYKNSKSIRLGSFLTEEEAHDAFYEGYLKHHGVAPW